MCDDLSVSRWESEERYHVCRHGMRVDFHCFDCEREAAKLNISRLLKERNDTRAEVARLKGTPQMTTETEGLALILKSYAEVDDFPEAYDIRIVKDYCADAATELRRLQKIEAAAKPVAEAWQRVEGGYIDPQWMEPLLRALHK